VLLAEAERARQARREGLELREGRTVTPAAPRRADVAPSEPLAAWQQGGPRESAASEVVG